MEVSVTHFEDYTEPTGEILTKYMLRVLYKPPGESKDGNGSKICYMLGKRYSDFKSLHSEAKDLIPNDYKFPNKSIFNNNATFTKERRIRGFDELIKLLMKSTEGFVLLKEFIEIEQQLEQLRTLQDHYSPAGVVAPVSSSSSRLSAAKEEQDNSSEEVLESSPHRNCNNNNKNNQPSLSSTSHKAGDIASFPEEMLTRRELQKQSLFLQQRQAIAISHLGDYLSIVGDEEAYGHVRCLSSDDLLRSRGFKSHFLFALKAAMIFYLIISLLGIVEVAFLSQALLTLVALTVLVMLIKLQIDRQEIIKEDEKLIAVSKGT